MLATAGNSPSERTAYFFIDLGWLRARGKEIYRATKPVNPRGIQLLINQSSQERGPFASTARRAYIYDGADRQERPKSWRAGDPEPGYRLTEEQIQLGDANQIVMRYGQKIDGRQKGVDTRLVADLIQLGYSGRYQVAHILTNDRDFCEPIQAISDIGIQVVLYEMSESDKKTKLVPELRSIADRVISLDRTLTSDLYSEIPRYELTKGSSGICGEVLDLLHLRGMRLGNRLGDEVRLAVTIGTPIPGEPARDARERRLPFLSAYQIGDGQAVSVSTQLAGGTTMSTVAVEDPTATISKFLEESSLLDR